jgi:UDP-2,3-diacylglucosamine pyrophosphatase LpxH
MSRRLFLSDIHMSAGLGLNPDGGKHSWEWFTDRDCRRLCWVLDTLIDAPAVPPIDEIVLLGDIFDNWIFPHDMKPPVFADIVKSPHISGVLSRLNQISQSTDILFLPGNHDMTLTHAELMSVLPRVGYGGQGKDKPMYGAGRISGEHGNATALFCSPDPKHQSSLPLGYFISRLAASADRDTGSHTPSVTDIVRELGHMLVKEQIAQGVFDAICAKAGVSQDAEILMPDDLWGGAPVKVGQIRDAYKDLVEEYEYRNGVIDAGLAIPAELGNLAPVADARILRFNSKLVLMGHTHRATVQQHQSFPMGRSAYVNSGCWCNNTEKATWVDVNKTDHSYEVSLMGCSLMPPDGSAPTVAPLFDKFVID